MCLWKSLQDLTVRDGRGTLVSFSLVSFYCFSVAQNILVNPQSQHFVLDHWTNVKQLVSMHFIISLRGPLPQSDQYLLLLIFPKGQVPHAGTGLTQTVMCTAQDRDICIPLQEVQTSRGAKQSMRAQTPTAQWADSELQPGGWYLFLNNLFKAKHLD